ncbi:MAG: DUF362 domain-containing protein [Acidobacteriota bacterium]
MNISRRKFNKNLLSFLPAINMISGSGSGLMKRKRQSIVIQAEPGSFIRINNDVNMEKVKKFLDKGIKKLTEYSSPDEGWRSMFSPGDKVGIKLSCLPGKPLSSSRGIVKAVIEGLASAGIKENNILVWERSNRELQNAGFPLSFKGVRVYGTDQYAGGGYSSEIEFSGSVGTCFSKIMYEVDALINIPVLKDHDLSGISCSMKNFYGAIYNPNKFHSNNCDPYIAELNAHSIIKKKLKLVICDASRIQINNGPAYYPKYSKNYGSVLMGTDQVALDHTGWQIIEKERKRAGLISLKDAGREPEYIESAVKLGLGENRDSKIDLIRI